MSDIVNVVLAQEVNSYDPWAWHDNFINPLAVTKNFRSLLLIHHNLSFLLNGLFITTDSDYQICVLEKLLCLFKDFSMAHMIHIEDTISVDTNRIIRVSSIGLLMIIKEITLQHQVCLVIEHSQKRFHPMLAKQYCYGKLKLGSCHY